MDRIRRGLIVIIAVVTALIGLDFVWLALPSAPLLGLIGGGVAVAIIALAVRQYRGLG